MSSTNNHVLMDDFVVYPSGDFKGTVDDLARRLKSAEELAEQIPMQEMIERGWISSEVNPGQWSSLILNVLSDDTRALFRKSDKASEAIAAAWLARVSQVAEYDWYARNMPDFEMFTEQELIDLVRMSVEPGSIADVPEILAERGILLVYERALKGMRLDGVVYRSKFGNPVIGISFRYPRLDYFWFTLLHELSHLKLHFESLECPILEDFDDENESKIEREANRYALNLIIPRRKFRNIGHRNIRSRSGVDAFAEELGIHPSLVAGILQRHMNRYDLFRLIVDEIDTRELVFGE